MRLTTTIILVLLMAGCASTTHLQNPTTLQKVDIIRDPSVVGQTVTVVLVEGVPTPYVFAESGWLTRLLGPTAIGAGIAAAGFGVGKGLEKSTIGSVEVGP